VNLSAYRRQRTHRAYIHPHLVSNSRPAVDTTSFDGNYSARMKANLVVFIIATVLVIIGVWLIDGLVPPVHTL
jgi:hypothetical protein